MVVRTNGERPDVKFWVSVFSLLLAIMGTWVSLSKTVAQNGTNIDRNTQEIRCMREDIQQVESTQREILRELRK